MIYSLAQSAPVPVDTTVVITGGFTTLLAFLVYFTKQLHSDGKAERKEAAAERLKTAELYASASTALAAVIDRNTDTHIRASVVLSKVEDRLEREEQSRAANREKIPT